MTIHQILLRYWGYSTFRPLQEEIIRSVLDGRDTLALLPTGGGKSICFQVPALAREGICVVISPLIALMKDQVDNLKKKGIRAAAIYSGMHPDEIRIVLDNCRYGDIRLLYISPERLATEPMRQALQRMQVSLLAVDEAHCISQWGYDFRPPYLDIARIRPLLPGVPVIALTATATGQVVTDIQEKLGFREENVFRKSFDRKNLTYLVIKEEDKRKRLLTILARVKGPGIIYVRNRRQTRELAEFLQKNGISADYYHAGLDPRTRSRRQMAWMNEERRIMVATNAFGMGIDKPNVRVVIHFDLPDCPEAYFQEAGRAGRDEKPAYAVLLYEPADLLDARRHVALSFPPPEVVRSVYQALGNYFQLPVGSGADLRFDFDLHAFAGQYGFQPVVVFNALKILENEGYLRMTEGLVQPPRVYIKAGREELYRFQVENEPFDHFLKTLLRSYGGILSDFTPVNEAEIARRSGFAPVKVSAVLRQLAGMKILDYLPQTDKPGLIFTTDRTDTREILQSPERYNERLAGAESRMERMIAYCENTGKCRNLELLAYFGETGSRRCGKCDSCIERNKVSLNQREFDHIVEAVKPLLLGKSCRIGEIIAAAAPAGEDKVIRALQWLVENEKVAMDHDRNYFWKRGRDGTDSD